MLDEHLGYVADRTRLEQFRAAVAKVVHTDDCVADLGCGTGVLGLLCLRAGAGFVFGIDSTVMLEVARETFARAGLAEQGRFIRDHSLRVELPERVDLVICDHVGYFGFDYGIANTVQDARRRFLKPGGRLIPAAIRLRVGAVEYDKAREKAEGWRAEAVPDEFHWLRQHGVNAKHADDELAARRSADRPQAFLPIDEAVEVKAGDLIKATLMARPDDNLIAWDVDLPATGRRFIHSTWQGLLLAPEDLMRSEPNHVPHLSPTGKARITVLGYCDGQRTAREIEQAVLRDHPDLFPSSEEISRFVAQALGRDTR